MEIVYLAPEQTFLDWEKKHVCPRCGHEWV